MKFGDLEINSNAREVKVDGKSILLSHKEFNLLLELASRPNTVFKIEHLFERVWGYDNNFDCRTVKVHMGNLRKKIERDPKKPTHIINVRGFGYKFIP